MKKFSEDKILALAAALIVLLILLAIGKAIEKAAEIKHGCVKTNLVVDVGSGIWRDIYDCSGRSDE